MYVYKMNIVVEQDEDLLLESILDQAVTNALVNHDATLVSANIEQLEGSNYGKCVHCGAWVSNMSEDHAINCFSNGMKVDNSWLCDVCLPKTHDYAF